MYNVEKRFGNCFDVVVFLEGDGMYEIVKVSGFLRDS